MHIQDPAEAIARMRESKPDFVLCYWKTLLHEYTPETTGVNLHLDAQKIYKDEIPLNSGSYFATPTVYLIEWGISGKLNYQN